MPELTPAEKILAVEVRKAVAALVRSELRERDDVGTLDRFAEGRWHTRLMGDTFLVTWDDGTVLCTIPRESVAMTVGGVRAMRAAPDRLN